MKWLIQFISNYIVKYVLTDIIAEWRGKIADIHSELDEMTTAYTRMQREMQSMKMNLKLTQ